MTSLGIELPCDYLEQWGVGTEGQGMGQTMLPAFPWGLTMPFFAGESLLPLKKLKV